MTATVPALQPSQDIARSHGYTAEEAATLLIDALITGATAADVEDRYGVPRQDWERWLRNVARVVDHLE